MDLKLGDTRLIIDACKARGVLRNQCAYVLATAYHETAHTIKPITELGSQKYLRGKEYWPFIGRGYVQLTWEENYKKAGGKLGVDFVKNPALLLQAKYAAPILVIGMIEGWFAGDKRGRHTLGRYITLSKSDFEGARRIINGTDRAALIAGYAQQYDDLLLKAGYGVAKAPPEPAKPIPAPQPPKPAAPPPAAPVPAPAPSKVTPLAAFFAIIGAALAIFWTHVVNFFEGLFSWLP